MIDQDRFNSAMVKLGAIFDREITATLLEAYYEALSRRLTEEQFFEACAKVTRTCKFFPKPAELLEAVHGTPDDQAEKAWQIAWGKVYSVGSYQSPDFKDPAIIATIREMGGWPAFCRPECEETWHRKRFLEVYRGFDAHRAGLQEIRALRGQHEQENDAAGLKAPDWAYKELPAGPTQRELPEGEPN